LSQKGAGIAHGAGRGRESIWLSGQAPAAHGNETPDKFHKAERPGSLEKSVGRGHQAGRGERQRERRTSILEGVAHHHCRYREQPENREWVHADALIRRDWAKDPRLTCHTSCRELETPSANGSGCDSRKESDADGRRDSGLFGAVRGERL